MTFAKYPVGGSGTGGVQTVADAAARALLVPAHGDLVVQLDTNELYEYNGTSWAVIADRTYNDPIVNADISASAAIDRSKLASGTASHVLINDGTGVMSSEATLAKSRGGTGADNSSVTFPSSGTIVTTTGSQALTNKTFDASLNTVSNIVDANITTTPGQGMQRWKLFLGTPNRVLINDSFGFVSEEAQLATSRGGTGVNSTATFPTSGVVVTEAGSQALTNKTIDADLNTLTDIADASIKTNAAIAHSKLANITAGSVLMGNASNVPTATAITGDVVVDSAGVTAISSAVIVDADVNASAAIARSKLASGTANHVLINDGTGVMTSEATLATSRGGTGVNSTASFPTSGVVVTEAGTQTLTNKKVSSTAAMTGALELPSGTTAQRPTPTAGMTRLNTDTNEFEGYYNSTWQSIGSGINEQPQKNYLRLYANSSAAPGTLSTLASATANLVSLTAFYADSTSGSSALTQSSNTSLRGSFNYLTATGTSDSAGARFVQFPAFALEGSDLGKPISLSFDVSGVTADGNWDVVVVRYNSSGTYQSLISVAGNASGATPPSAKLPTGTTTFNGFFVPDSTTAGDLYAVRLRSLANTVQIRVDNLFCGQQPIRTGGSVTDWQSYTPTGPWTAGSPVYTGRWRRVGDSIELLIDVAFSTTTNASTSQFLWSNLLNGLGVTVDASKFPNNGSLTALPLGNWSILNSGVTIYNGGISLTPLALDGVELYTAAGVFVSNTNPITLDVGDNVSLRVTLPITGWSSNVTMADRSVEEFVFNSSTSTTTDTTSFAYGPGGAALQAFAPAGTNSIQKRVRFATPIQATDSIILEFSYLGIWTPYYFYTFTANDAGTANAGAVIFPVNSTDVNVNFYSVPAFGGTWSSEASAGVRWRVRKISAGAQVGYPIASSNIILQDTISVLTGATTLSANATNVRYICNSGSAFTVTLPAVASVRDGTIFRFKNIGAGVVTLDGNASETIDGATTLAMSQYVSIDLIEYNGAWYVL